MNKTFRIIWNMATQQWIVTSELGKCRKKQKLFTTIIGGTFLGFSMFNTGIAAETTEAETTEQHVEIEDTSITKDNYNINVKGTDYALVVDYKNLSEASYTLKNSKLSSEISGINLTGQNAARNFTLKDSILTVKAKDKDQHSDQVVGIVSLTPADSHHITLNGNTITVTNDIYADSVVRGLEFHSTQGNYDFKKNKMVLSSSVGADMFGISHVAPSILSQTGNHEITFNNTDNILTLNATSKTMPSKIAQVISFNVLDGSINNLYKLNTSGVMNLNGSIDSARGISIFNTADSPLPSARKVDINLSGQKINFGAQRSRLNKTTTATGIEVHAYNVDRTEGDIVLTSTNKNENEINDISMHLNDAGNARGIVLNAGNSIKGLYSGYITVSKAKDGATGIELKAKDIEFTLDGMTMIRINESGLSTGLKVYGEDSVHLTFEKPKDNIAAGIMTEVGDGNNYAIQILGGKNIVVDNHQTHKGNIFIKGEDVSLTHSVSTEGNVTLQGSKSNQFVAGKIFGGVTFNNDNADNYFSTKGVAGSKLWGRGDVKFIGGNTNTLVLQGTDNTGLASIDGTISLSGKINQVELKDLSILRNDLLFESDGKHKLTINAGESSASDVIASAGDLTIHTKGGTFGKVTGADGGVNSLIYDGVTEAKTFNTPIRYENLDHLKLINGSQLTSMYEFDIRKDLTLDKGTSMTVTGDQYNIGHDLLGQGDLIVNLNKKDSLFTLGRDQLSGHFEGNIYLTQGTYEITDKSKQQLAKGWLIGKSNSNSNSVIVHNANPNSSSELANLMLDGGTIRFDYDSLGLPVNEYDALKIDQFKNNGGSIALGNNLLDNVLTGEHVNVNGSDFFAAYSDTGITLISANKLTGNANVELIDYEGHSIAADKNITVKQDQGILEFGYVGTAINGSDTGEAGKINITGGLKSITSTGDFIIDHDGTNETDQLNALLKGDGGFTFNITDANKPITIAGGNHYLGDTTVKGGSSIHFGGDNAFGIGGKLTVLDDTAVVFNGNSQILSEIDLSSGGGSININNNTATGDHGRLIINHGGSIVGDNALIGDSESQLVLGNKTGDYTLSIIGANDRFDSDIVINEGGTIALKDVAGLGRTGTIMLGKKNNENGTTTHDGRVDLTRVGGLIGDNVQFSKDLGSIEQGSGELILGYQDDGAINGDNLHLHITGDNSRFTGLLNINNGNVWVKENKQLGVGTVELKNAQSIIHLEGKTTDGTEFVNQFIGQGQIEINTGNDITLSGNSDGFTGNINVNKGSNLTLKNEGIDTKGTIYLGSAVTQPNDSASKLIFDNDASDAQTFEGTIEMVDGAIPHNKGEVHKIGLGEVILAKDQGYMGKTVVDGGKLTLGDINFNSEHIEVKDRATLQIKGTNMINSAVKVDNGAILAGMGHIKSLENSGKIYVGGQHIEGDRSFGQLIIDGNYTGVVGSSLYFGTKFHGDDISNELTWSQDKDLLVIKGDSFGQSDVYVEKLGEPIGTTTGIVNQNGLVNNNGILLIEVQGASQANFVLQNRVISGIHDYALVKGIDGSWYLNYKINGGTDGGGGGGFIFGGGERYRPEVNAYLANAMLANNLFMMRMNDRRYVEDSHRLWMRMDTSFGKFKSGFTDLSTDIKRFLIQAGYDFYQMQTYSGTLSVGGMMGYGSAESKTTNRTLGYRAKSNIDSFAIGVYGTYKSEQGSYIDSWIQYVHANSKVDGHHLAQEKYKNKGLLVSLEVGHQFQVLDNLYLTPQAQLTYMGVKMDNHVERNGTHIRGNRDNYQVRVGARIHGEYQTSIGLLKPFADLNYFHNTRPHYTDFTNFQGITSRAEQAGAKNIGQITLGTDAALGKDTNIFGKVSHAFGKESYKDTKISIGLRHQF